MLNVILFNQGNYDEAVVHLRRCLKLMGRQLSETPLEISVSLLWNCVRQLLNLLHIGWWLEYAAQRVWRWVSGRDLKLFTVDSAVIYHQLLQLSLSGNLLFLTLMRIFM